MFVTKAPGGQSVFKIAAVLAGTTRNSLELFVDLPKTRGAARKQKLVPERSSREKKKKKCFQWGKRCLISLGIPLLMKAFVFPLVFVVFFLK